MTSLESAYLSHLGRQADRAIVAMAEAVDDWLCHPDPECRQGAAHWVHWSRGEDRGTCAAVAGLDSARAVCMLYQLCAQAISDEEVRFWVSRSEDPDHPSSEHGPEDQAAALQRLFQTFMCPRRAQ